MKIKKGPIFSLVTVCFNEVNNIEKTCKSVTSQAFKDFEWVVIDGGSTDGTVDVLKKYRKEMSYFVSEKDSGIYNAMNKGIKKSKGEYLLFLNGGDYFKNKAVLNRAKEFILKNKKQNEIYYGNLEYDNGEVVDYSKSTLNKRFFLTKTISHQATFIKCELFKKFGLYNENYKICADFDFWIKTIIFGKAKTECIPLVISVFDQKGVSTNSKLARKQIKERNDILLKYKIINKTEAKIAEIKYFILMILKKLNIYNLIRRQYRRVIKR